MTILSTGFTFKSQLVAETIMRVTKHPSFTVLVQAARHLIRTYMVSKNTLKSLKKKGLYFSISTEFRHGDFTQNCTNFV